MATQIDDGGPAFPVLCDYIDGKPRGMQTTNRGGWCEGLSIRDWFAGQALCGYLPDPSVSDRGGGMRLIAKAAYDMADAMIAARNARKDGD